MNSLLGATLSDINSWNVLFAIAASSTVSLFSSRVSGLSVVFHSCTGIISPKPLNLWMDLDAPSGSVARCAWSCDSS